MTEQAERVLIIGTGLLGTSLGLALSQAGRKVQLDDIAADAVSAAIARGAGTGLATNYAPDLVVVAVPPAATAAVMAAALSAYPNATVTDVASVKTGPLAELRRLSADTNRVVGGHPMAGREVSGPAGATADLFEGRVWVVTPLPESEPVRVAQVCEIVRACGGSLIELTPETHDRAVALTSHAPQMLSSLLAGLLDDVAPEDVAVSGQGLRDLTRIAGSDPQLWTDILGANASEVAAVLAQLGERLTQAVSTLNELATPSGLSAAARNDLETLLVKGNSGKAKIPGKHGVGTNAFATVVVSIEDRPGELGRLFAAIGDAGVSVEDVRIDHAMGRPTGLVEIAVSPPAAVALSAHLSESGWRLR